MTKTCGDAMTKIIYTMTSGVTVVRDVDGQMTIDQVRSELVMNKSITIRRSDFKHTLVQVANVETVSIEYQPAR